MALTSVPQYSSGASLRAWGEIFPFAGVTGFDVDKETMLWGPRLRTHVCNTLNVTRVQELLHEQVFDFIFDDGLHPPDLLLDF